MYDLRLENALINDRYHVRRRLRCGSYTELFIGFDRVNSHIVIIKALNVALKGTPDEALERKLIEYFQTEAEILDRLQHPHIINLLEHDTTTDLEGRDFRYLVLEYMPGGDLMTLCRQGRLPLARALQYTHQVCLGLGYAHQHGIIHRDIKPQNLLLDATCRSIKISDFGIAKVWRGEDDDVTRGIGTETYAPPECFDFQGNLSSLTPAADVYGLAKTLYVMVTGEAPREFFQRPIAQLPPAIATQSFAEELLRIVNRATQHEPSERYSDVESFWHALEALVPVAGEMSDTDAAGEPVVPSGIGSPPPIQSVPRKDPFAVERLEVPIQVEPAEVLDESTVVTTPRSGPKAPDSAGLAELKPRTWSRRLFTAGLATSFMATLFWVHGVVSGNWDRSTGVVTAVNLNLRAAPNMSSPSIGVLPGGIEVRIRRLSRDEQWYEVETNYWDGRNWRRGRGWVSKFYVKLEGEPVR